MDYDRDKRADFSERRRYRGISYAKHSNRREKEDVEVRGGSLRVLDETRSCASRERTGRDGLTRERELSSHPDPRNSEESRTIG